MKKMFIFFLMISISICAFSVETTSQFLLNFDETLTNGDYTYPDIDLSREELLETYNLMNDIDGIFPSDICYVQEYGKIYLYGNKFIHVYDSNNYNLVDVIEISEYGHFSPSNSFPFTPFNDNRLAYANGRLYCATESLELLMIDVEDNNIISIQPRPSIVNQDSDTFENIVLEYNPQDNRLYWIINDLDGNAFSWGDNIGGKLAIYDILNDDLLLVHEIGFTDEWEEDYFENFIRDIEFSPISDYFYLSVNHELKVLDTVNFEEVESYETVHYAGLLEYVYMGIINKLICAPVAEYENTQPTYFKIIDFNNPNVIDLYANYRSYSRASCVDYVNNKVYFAYRSMGYAGIDEINFDNNTLNDFYDANDVTIYHLLFNPNDNTLFSCKGRSVEIIDCSITPAIQINDVDNKSRHCYAAIDAINNRVFIPSLSKASLEIFSGDGNHIESIQVGEEAYYGISYENGNKIFIYKTYGEKILIFDTSTHSVNELILTNRVITVEVDNINGKLIILYKNGDIEWYNCDTMIQENYCCLTYPGIAYSKGMGFNNNKLYAGSNEGIDIWEVSYPHGNLVHIASFAEIAAFKFIFDNDNQRTYAISNESISVIDNNSNITSYRIQEGLSQFQYCNENNKIYFLTHPYGDNTLYSLDIDSGQINPILQPYTGDGFLYLSYINNELYINAFDVADRTSSIYNVNCENEILESYIQIPYFSTQMCVNNYNNKVNVLTLFNREEECEMALTTIEPENSNTVSILPLNYKERMRSSSGLSLRGFYEGSSLIPYQDKLYVVRGNNVLQEIQCYQTETKTYTFPSQFTLPDAGWKWLSFDILYPEQEDNIAEFFLAPISGFDQLDYALFKPHTPNSQELEIRFYPPPQQNLDHIFTSPYGYKFKTINACEFTVTGQRCEAGTSIHLYGNNQDNWIGYFLEDTQLVYDAFGGHLDEITMIKAQHWGIRKVNGVWPPPVAAYTLSPGDMVIVYCERDIPTFSWSSGDTREKYNVPESQDFTYEEEADYIPVFIELDPEDMPSEIGAFVDGECKGATVVRDTSAQICAYILENQGENLEFEFSYGSREQNKQIRVYGICEPETSKTVKGAIQIDSSRDCYYVSFKDRQNSPPSPAKVEITNFPNPFNPETTLFFSLPNEQKIELTIYNLKGQKVRQLAKGQFPSGNNSIVWNGKDANGKPVGSGIYFYKLKTNEKVISKKMLLLK